jgi:hypothetical protein
MERERLTNAEDDSSEPAIRYAPVREQLRDICVAVINRVDREARPALTSLHPGLPAVLMTTARVSGTTLAAIERLWWNTEDGERIHLEIATAIPPLTRTILDSVFTLVLLFDAPERNVRWYHASGWRDAQRSHGRVEERYGSDPRWRDWLAESARWVEEFKVDVTPEEAEAPSMIEWWPIPGKLTRPKRDGTHYLRDSDAREFLVHLNDWYYGELSGDSHLSYMVMLRRGGPLVESPSQRAILLKSASTAFLNSVTLYLALMSEIAVGARLPTEAAVLLRLWTHFQDWQRARELSEIRYRPALEACAG